MKSEEEMIKYVEEKIKEILVKHTRSELFGNFAFKTLANNGIPRKIFHEIMANLRPWEAWLFWDLRREIFDSPESGDVIYQLLRQEAPLSIAGIISLAFNDSLRVEMAVRILRRVIEFMLMEGDKIVPADALQAFINRLGEIHARAGEEKVLTAEAFTAEMVNVYRGLRPVEEESTKEQDRAVLLYRYIAAITARVNVLRKRESL